LRLGIYVGAGNAESDGTDIFNVFILDPRGEIAGRAYKSNAEANVFKRGRREHVVETPIGRIGIGICADNQFASHLRLMYELHGGEDLLGFRSAKRNVGRGSRSEDYQHGICTLNRRSSIACRPFDARFRVAH